MRKNVTVTGIGHKSGKSKSTQKEYDFYVMHGHYSDPEVDGVAAFQATIPDEYVPMIALDEEYLVLTHFYNGKEQIDGIFKI